MAGKQNHNPAKVSPLLYFSFIPFVNTIALFHMNNRVGNKKWLRLGWVILGLNLLLIIGLIGSFALSNVRVAQYPYDTQPDLSDYVDSEMRSEGDYYDTPEYHDFEDALEEWRDSEEYRDAVEQNERYRAAVNGVAIGCLMIFPVVNLVVFFYILSQIGSYRSSLAKQDNKNAALSRLSGVTHGAASYPGQNYAPVSYPATDANVQHIFNQAVQNSVSAGKPVTEAFMSQERPAAASIQNSSVGAQMQMEQKVPVRPQTIAKESAGARKLNLNTASVDEISALPGLTVVDARRALRFREEHGGFESLDEFYEAVSIKPHVLVKIQDLITVAEPDRKGDAGSSVRRRIDL